MICPAVSASKLNELVRTLLEQYGGGTPYFDALDSHLRQPENLVIVQALFRNVENVVLSGSFGYNFLGLLAAGKVHVPGSIVVLNGGLRHGITPRQVMSRGPIRNKLFTFIDDSYYKGRTLRSVQEYLSRFDALVMNTRVAYDGSQSDPENLYALYTYRSGTPVAWI